VQPYHLNGLGESFSLIWVIIRLSWKLIKIRTTRLNFTPKTGIAFPKKGVIFLLCPYPSSAYVFADWDDSLRCCDQYYIMCRWVRTIVSHIRAFRSNNSCRELVDFFFVVTLFVEAAMPLNRRALKRREMTGVPKGLDSTQLQLIATISRSRVECLMATKIRGAFAELTSHSDFSYTRSTGHSSSPNLKNCHEIYPVSEGLVPSEYKVSLYFHVGTLVHSIKTEPLV